MLIQSLYEQILVSQSLRDSGFKNFIKDIVNKNLVHHDNILERAEELNLNRKDRYNLVLVKNKNKKDFLEKETIERNFQITFRKTASRIALAKEDSYLLLIAADENISKEENIKAIKNLINKFNLSLKAELPNIDLNFGIADIAAPITSTYKSYKRALKALEMGHILYGDLYYITYSELGPLAWIDIKSDEIDLMKDSIKDLLDQENSQELIETLDTYLESNMNYSLSSKKLFIHINTVRKRIEYINDLIDMDLEDPISRLKLEILLKLIYKGK